MYGKKRHILLKLNPTPQINTLFMARYRASHHEGRFVAVMVNSLLFLLNLATAVDDSTSEGNRPMAL